MGISLLSSALTVAGIAGNLLGLKGNITFYDQEKFENIDKKKGIVGFFKNAIAKKKAEIFGGSILSKAFAMDLSVSKASQITEYPLMDGEFINDYKVKKPNRISCSISLPTLNPNKTIDQFTKYFESGKFIIIKTKVGVFKNMVLETVPTRLDYKNVDKPVFSLTFAEARLVRHTGNSTKKKKTLLSKVLSFLSGAIK